MMWADTQKLHDSPGYGIYSLIMVEQFNQQFFPHLSTTKIGDLFIISLL